MTKRNRIIAILLVFAVVFVMAFSVFVIAAEAQHDCSGDDCPICQLVAVCENNLKCMSLALVCAAVIFAPACFGPVAKQNYNEVFESCTPVSLKVKLSD